MGRWGVHENKSGDLSGVLYELGTFSQKLLFGLFSHIKWLHLKMCLPQPGAVAVWSERRSGSPWVPDHCHLWWEMYVHSPDSL